MKKLISILVTLTMLLAMAVPFSVSVTALDETDAWCVIYASDGSVVGYYDSMKTATGAAPAGSTIKLLKDITYSGDGEDWDFWQNGALPSGITVDMNGKTITSNYSGGMAAYFKSCKDVVVKNGTFAGAQNLANCIRIHHRSGGASITFENVKFLSPTESFVVFMGDNGINATFKDCYVEMAQNCISPQCKNVTVNLINTTIIRNSPRNNTFMFNMYYSCGGTNTINIYSGLYLDAATDKPMFRLTGTGNMNIYGGSFITKANALFSNTNGTANVYGGQLGGFGNASLVLNAGTKDVNVVSTTFLSGTAKGALGTGDTVYSHGNFNWYAKADNVPVLRDGAAVRLVGDHNGIRFQSDISAAAIAAANAVKDEGTELSYGTLLVMADTVAAGTRVYTHAALDNAEADYRDLAATADGITENADGSITVNAALVDVQTANLGRKITAVSYIKYTVDGNDVYVYSLVSAPNNSRSMSEVAEAALGDTEAGYTAEQKAVLQGYVVS